MRQGRRRGQCTSRRQDRRCDSARGNQREGSEVLFSAATDRTAFAVGIPQSQNSGIASVRLRRSNSTPAQLVPPAPATSMIVTPTSRRRCATFAEIPAPISFTISGTGSDRTSIAMPASTPRNRGRPSGCRELLERIQMNGERICPNKIDEERQASSARLAWRPPPRRYCRRSGFGGTSRTTLNVR